MIIDESYPEVPFIPAMDIVAATRAASTELDPIDPNDEGMSDYSGELLSDVDFGAFSHSALVRIADEVCLQMHLLNLSFTIAVGKRAKDDAALARSIRTKQLIGIAGVAAERIHRRSGSPGGVEGCAAGAANCIRCSTRLPTCRPSVDPDFVHVRRSPAYEDGAWISLVSPVRTAAAGDRAGRRSASRAEVSGTESDWTVRVIETDTAAKELPEVAVCQVQWRVRRGCSRNGSLFR